jgi:nitroreductase
MTDVINPTLELLLRRRSVGAGFLGEPGPTEAQLQHILTAAARVPDHKKLVPWRFVVFQGPARGAFGKMLADTWAREAPAGQATPERLQLESGRFERAPLVVGVVSRVLPNPGAPDWEQQLSAGAACQNFLIATTALGFGACWITEWYGYSRGVAQALGLEAHERMAGFIYVGTAREKPPERDRPKLSNIVTHWQGQV